MGPIQLTQSVSLVVFGNESQSRALAGEWRGSAHAPPQLGSTDSVRKELLPHCAAAELWKEAAVTGS